MKVNLVSIFILLFTLNSLGAENPSVKITTMNVSWYGSTHFPPENDDEREGLLKDFFTRELDSSDIILFQEITKPLQFQQLLKSNLKCLTYDDRGRAHQYVLTCFNQDKFEVLVSNDVLFDPVRAILISDKKERLRDVLFLKLKSKVTGQVINTYNLHLKSGNDLAAAEKRKEQSMLLLKQLKNQNLPLDESIIIGGDFNSYDRKINNQFVNEIENFLEVSSKNGFSFFTKQDQPTTLAFVQKTFDFLLINKKTSVKDYKVHPVCLKLKNPKSLSEDFMFFKDNISDHCPVTSIIEI